MKRYDIGLEGQCPEPERAVMQECTDGEFVRFEDVERLLAALHEIAEYDRNSPHGEGICHYGCDAPWVAKTALGIACNVPNEIGDCK